VVLQGMLLIPMLADSLFTEYTLVRQKPEEVLVAPALGHDASEEMVA
jgi:hypothetical protein